MSKTTFVKVTGAVSAAVATNGTIVLTAPAGYTAATTLQASGAFMYVHGMGVMFVQGASNFSTAYSTDVTVTYLGATTIPAGSTFDYYIPLIGSLTALTDSTGGTASNTLAAITAGASYAQADLTAIKNAIASLAAKIANIQTALINANINNV